MTSENVQEIIDRDLAGWELCDKYKIFPDTGTITVKIQPKQGKKMIKVCRIKNGKVVAVQG